MRRLGKFGLRDLFYVTAIVALAITLWLTAGKLPPPARPGGFPAGAGQTTVEGPLTVNYKVGNTRYRGVSLQALHLLDDSVVFEYPGGRFSRISSAALEELEWEYVE